MNHDYSYLANELWLAVKLVKVLTTMAFKMDLAIQVHFSVAINCNVASDLAMAMVVVLKVGPD